MTINKWFTSSQRLLEKANISTARLDCLVLLEDVTNKDRSWLLAHPEYIIDAGKIKKLNILIQRRAKHEPLAYIRGRTEFYGHDFMVTPDTLEPRPETETMIELYEKHPTLKVVDVGTGSGAIAITIKILSPDTDVYATEVNEKALKIAEQNNKTHQTNVVFKQGNLIDPFIEMMDSKTSLMCNLPYVPNKYQLNSAAKHEPEIAIFGGDDGLDIYRQMFTQIDKLKNKPKYIYTESLPFQHTHLTQIAKQSGYKLKTMEDFIQQFSHQ